VAGVRAEVRKEMSPVCNHHKSAQRPAILAATEVLRVAAVTASMATEEFVAVQLDECIVGVTAAPDRIEETAVARAEMGFETRSVLLSAADQTVQEHFHIEK